MNVSVLLSTPLMVFDVTRIGLLTWPPSTAVFVWIFTSLKVDLHNVFVIAGRASVTTKWLRYHRARNASVTEKHVLGPKLYGEK